MSLFHNIICSLVFETCCICLIPTTIHHTTLLCSLTDIKFLCNSSQSFFPQHTVLSERKFGKDYGEWVIPKLFYRWNANRMTYSYKFIDWLVVNNKVIDKERKNALLSDHLGRILTLLVKGPIRQVKYFYTNSLV